MYLLALCFDEGGEGDERTNSRKSRDGLDERVQVVKRSWSRKYRRNKAERLEYTKLLKPSHSISRNTSLLVSY